MVADSSKLDLKVEGAHPDWCKEVGLRPDLQSKRWSMTIQDVSYWKLKHQKC